MNLGSSFSVFLKIAEYAREIEPLLCHIPLQYREKIIPELYSNIYQKLSSLIPNGEIRVKLKVSMTEAMFEQVTVYFKYKDFSSRWICLSKEPYIPFLLYDGKSSYSCCVYFYSGNINSLKNPIPYNKVVYNKNFTLTLVRRFLGIYALLNRMKFLLKEEEPLTAAKLKKFQSSFSASYQELSIPTYHALKGILLLISTQTQYKPKRYWDVEIVLALPNVCKAPVTVKEDGLTIFTSTMK